MSGFICEAFGYIPRTGESIKVFLEKENEEEQNEESKPDHSDQKEKHQLFKLEVLSFLFSLWLGLLLIERLEPVLQTRLIKIELQICVLL